MSTVCRVVMWLRERRQKKQQYLAERWQHAMILPNVEKEWIIQKKKKSERCFPRPHKCPMLTTVRLPCASWRLCGRSQNTQLAEWVQFIGYGSPEEPVKYANSLLFFFFYLTRRWSFILALPLRCASIVELAGPILGSPIDRTKQKKRQSDLSVTKINTIPAGIGL